MTVVSDGVFRAFSRSWATRAGTLDTSKAFDRALHGGLFHKLRSFRLSGQVCGLISSFISNRRL